MSVEPVVNKKTKRVKNSAGIIASAWLRRPIRVTFAVCSSINALWEKIGMLGTKQGPIVTVASRGVGERSEVGRIAFDQFPRPETVDFSSLVRLSFRL